ncbi:MAG: hypothetical protein KTR21_08380 [Rhodobacteraceae bacterium]|nr:hypothetical protein [Paracoccaceae bacterium]
MKREKITRAIGALVALLSLGLLLVNEGLLFHASPTPASFSIRGLDCSGDPDALYKGASVNSLEILADISSQSFFSLDADLEIKIGFDAFSRAGCEQVEIASEESMRFKDNSSFYDSNMTAFEIQHNATGERLPGPTTSGVLAFKRNDNKPSVQQDWGNPNRHEFVKVILPRLFERLSASDYAARLNTGDERHRFRFAESYGKVGAGASNGRRNDLSFRLQAFERISRIITIIFATLLGVGVGAVFEASLILSTARQIEKIRRDAVGDGPVD